jgi:hypothetical protein
MPASSVTTKPLNDAHEVGTVQIEAAVMAVAETCQLLVITDDGRDPATLLQLLRLAE